MIVHWPIRLVLSVVYFYNSIVFVILMIFHKKYKKRRDGQIKKLTKH